MNFNTFRSSYPARPPREGVIKNNDECIQMSPADGLLEFVGTWGEEVKISPLPRTDSSRGNVYLWAIALSTVPYAEETVEFGTKLESNVIKHTNLTGGKDAHCGGELWFISDTEILIGGDSGRYGPNSEVELTDAARAFKSTGCKVATLGYDEDSGLPATILVGAPKWI